MGEKKNSINFNIIKNDPTDGHGGFGAGSFSLDNVSPIIIDVEAGKAEIDVGAMHARSTIERGIKFLNNKEEVPNGKPYWLVWVTVEQKETGPYYAGVTACEMTVDRDIRRGYKSLPEHVNHMSRSIKGQIIVKHMDSRSKEILANFLQQHNNQMWETASNQLKNDLQV